MEPEKGQEPIEGSGSMIEKTYAHHIPSAAAGEKIMQLREAFSVLCRKIKLLAPASREQSIALTNLETTAMWAIKSVVVNDPGSTVVVPPRV